MLCHDIEMGVLTRHYVTNSNSIEPYTFIKEYLKFYMIVENQSSKSKLRVTFYCLSTPVANYVLLVTTLIPLEIDLVSLNCTHYRCCKAKSTGFRNILFVVWTLY
jgi:hypothetical protein